MNLFPNLQDIQQKASGQVVRAKTPNGGIEVAAPSCQIRWPP